MKKKRSGKHTNQLLKSGFKVLFTKILNGTLISFKMGIKFWNFSHELEEIIDCAAAYLPIVRK